MQRQSVIILTCYNEKPVVRGNFKKLCFEFNLPYHTLKMKKFPIEYDGCIIHKVEFK